MTRGSWRIAAWSALWDTSLALDSGTHHAIGHERSRVRNRSHCSGVPQPASCRHGAFR